MLNLVKYAGDHYVTLAEFTQTRDAEGYSDHASVKSAIRTFVVKQNPNGYIAFRGEAQLKNIIQENKNNPMFNPNDFQGTRTALIIFDMVNQLDERFMIDKKQKSKYNEFLNKAKTMIKEANSQEATSSDDLLSGRSAIEKQLRQELARIDKDIEIKQKNREKILTALNAISSLELEDAN